MLSGAQKESEEKAPFKMPNPFGDKCRMREFGMGIVCINVKARAKRVMMKGRLICSRCDDFFEQYVK
tara:strand:- start:66 stop:266 length:201 start_codon:yes stop_codon:yes gene_type:complete